MEEKVDILTKKRGLWKLEETNEVMGEDHSEI